MSTSPDTTQLLIDASAGDEEAVGELLDHVYEEMRRIAHRELQRRRPGHTLNTTALVHEAYLKLFDRERLAATDRVHFLALASRAMRSIIVDHFRAQQAEKRGGDRDRIDLDGGQIPVESRGDVLLALDEALSRLSSVSERLGSVVEYRFFGGMTQEEVGLALGIDQRTVRRDWRKARAFLANDLRA